MIKCQSAVDHLEGRLDKLMHPEAGLLKLVQFTHTSPGLDTLKRQITECLIMEIEKDHVIEPKSQS